MAADWRLGESTMSTARERWGEEAAFGGAGKSS